MTDFWILSLIFSTMYPVQAGRCWITTQSVPESSIYQPDKELNVDIGDSATLRCCVNRDRKDVIAWFKQPSRTQPQLMVTGYKPHGETFFPGFQWSHFRTEIFANRFNLTILNIVQTDEAMYYCALLKPIPVFGDGTYLKIKGKNVTVSTETSKPALCEATLHRNNTREKTVLGLGTALGFCTLLIFSLIYFILRRRKCENSRMNTSTEDSPGMNQESESELLNYATVQFTKRKVTAEKEKTGSSDECL